MSFIYYNGSIIPRMELNKATATYHRFDKFWGKEIKQNGIGEDVEVYKSRRNVYVNHFIQDTVVKRFIKALGIKWYDFTSQKVDGEIETIYFYLRPASYTAPTNEMITEALDRQFLVDDIIEVTISYGGALRKYIKEHSLPWYTDSSGVIETAPLNTEEIRTVLASNPWYYYANSRHIEYTNNTQNSSSYDGSGNHIRLSGITSNPSSTPVCDISSTLGSLGVLALIDNGDVFEPILNSNGSPQIINEIISTDSTSEGEVIKYTYTDLKSHII